MATIRIGLIGLSANAISSWAEKAHLPYLQSDPRYEITALCNTSVSSAEKAINHFNLPASTKAYDSVATLAADPDVDLVVVSVRVQNHYEAVKPALLAGKGVFCEWPFSVNATEAQELAALAKEKGVKTMVGVQGRASPVVVKLKELVNSGAIGEVVSTDVAASLGPRMEAWTENASFVLDINSGGTPLNIRFGHFLDPFCHVLGEFESHHSLLATNGKEVKVYDVPLTDLARAAEDPQKPYRVAQRTSSDEILLHGRLEGGAVASLHFRTGPPEPDGMGLRWLITGTQGSIEISHPQSVAFLQFVDTKIRVRKHGGDVEEVGVEWDREGAFKAYGEITFAANTGRLYKAWADGDTRFIMDFERAVKRHELIDDMIKQAGKERI
ncbi:NAD(P)-binding protein [Cenococcum geophilum]